MKNFLLGVILIFCFKASAQQASSPTYTFAAKLHYGYILNFTEDVAHLSNQHYPAIELNLTQQTVGKKTWQKEYNYPQIGYSLFYYAFDPQKVVGNSLVFLMHAGKKFHQSKRYGFQWRLGFGGAYVEKRFNKVDNYKNNIISQRINFSLSGQLNFNYFIHPKLAINTGIGLLHISNGAIKLPNFGINLPSAHLGLAYVFGTNPMLPARDSLLKGKRKTNVHVGVFMGLKEVYPAYGPKYFLGGWNVLVERRYNNKTGLHVGVDLSYDHSKRAEIEKDTILSENNFFSRSQSAIVFGHELYFDKLSLLTQMGIYLHNPTHLDKGYYQKVGLKYYLSKNIYTNLTMKIHLGVADWLEWGVGLRL